MFNPNLKAECERFSSSSSWGWLVGAITWLRRFPVILLERVRRARLALHAGRIAGKTNGRALVGLSLILIVAPLAGAAYQVFDVTHVDRTWWWRTWYDFLYVQGQYACIILCLLGAALLLPQNSKRSYFLTAPISLYVAKILWLCTVTSNDQFNASWLLIPAYFFIAATIIAFILVFTFNWLVTLHFHKREGIRARIDGVIDLNRMHLIDDAEALKILRREREAYKKSLEL